MRPIETERERRKYEMGMAMISLRHMERKRKQQAVTNFGSLQWRDELATAQKRRKIEEERADKLKKKKEEALRKAKENDDGNEEAEEEPPRRPSVKVKSSVPKKYMDVQTPKNVIGELVGGFKFSNFNNCSVTY